MPLDTAAPVYAEAQKVLWDTMAELARVHPAEDVLDALSDAYVHHDEPSTDNRRMERIGRALQKVWAESEVGT
jgi:hypothetical protein